MKIPMTLCKFRSTREIPINSVNAVSVTSSIKINVGNLNVELPDTIPAATLRSVIEVLKC